MSWIAEAYSIKRQVRNVPVEKLAHAIKLWTNYVMAKIVSFALTAKKTWVNPGSLTSAAVVPAI